MATATALKKTSFLRITAASHYRGICIYIYATEEEEHRGGMRRARARVSLSGCAALSFNCIRVPRGSDSSTRAIGSRRGEIFETKSREQ